MHLSSSRNGVVSAHPPAQDLVDGCTLFQGAFGHYFGPHFLHVKHKGI